MNLEIIINIYYLTITIAAEIVNRNSRIFVLKTRISVATIDANNLVEINTNEATFTDINT